MARSWGPGDRQQLRDFFTGVGLREAQGIGVGDAVELIHEGQVTIGRVAQVHGLQALVDLGNDVSTVRGLEDLLPASRDGLDQQRRASIREAVRGITQKTSMWVEGMTPLGGVDYRIALGHDPHQPPTQTEVLRFVASQYPGVRVLDGETVRPGLMRLVIARGEAHEIPGLTGPDAHGGGAFDSAQGPNPRGFDDARYDERDSEHIGGPGLAVAELRSAETGEVARREAIINEWVEATGRRPNPVEYAKVAQVLRSSPFHKRQAQIEGVAPDLASRMTQERQTNPTAEKALDRAITNYLARAPGALDRIDQMAYEQLLEGAISWLYRYDAKRLNKLREQFAPEMEVPELDAGLGGGFMDRIRDRLRPRRERMFEEYERQSPEMANVETSDWRSPHAPSDTGLIDPKLLGGQPPAATPELPEVPERAETPADENSMNMADEPAVPEPPEQEQDQNDWLDWLGEGAAPGESTPGPTGNTGERVTLPPGTKLYPTVMDDSGEWNVEEGAQPLESAEEGIIVRPLDRARTIVTLPSQGRPFAVDNQSLQRTAALEQGEKPRMPPAAAGFRVHVASVRSRGAYIEAKMKFDAETAQDISSLGLKRALSTALERRATEEWYRYGFLGKIRILDLDRKKGTAVLECQSSQASNFPLEFVGPDEDMDDTDGYL